MSVSDDPDYDRYGHGLDDMGYVKFDSSGNVGVYDLNGIFLYSAHISNFSGYIGGTTIGVGTNGLHWENVAGGVYWFGKNGVLYSANTNTITYGLAIN